MMVAGSWMRSGRGCRVLLVEEFRGWREGFEKKSRMIGLGDMGYREGFY